MILGRERSSMPASNTYLLQSELEDASLSLQRYSKLINSPP